MTAKFAGLPFNLKASDNSNIFYLLPGAITINDILNKNGYKQLFIFGSEKHFASRDVFLETHGNVEIHDIDWYKENGMLPKNYRVFWGFEDKKLYDFAKYELQNLEKQTSPFMFGLLTVDTHMPTGWQCEDCPKTEDSPLRNSIRCSDMKIFEFLEWCKKQSWYEDTVIVIMGDHLFHDTEKTTPFDNSTNLSHSEIEGIADNRRRWIDIFINASPVNGNFIEKNRDFSSFDMYPTILAALGCRINEDKLGFGVNLFSNEKTLCERFSEDYINSETMVRNKQYENMEFGIDK